MNIETEKFPNGTIIHAGANVYPTADLGDNVSIGAYAEVGHLVKIGDNSRIGAYCFLCEGVEVGDRCFLGPRVTTCNDAYPPSPKERWMKTIIEDGARIGAAATLLPGITIGAGSLIGAGSMVVCNIPPKTVWAGNPAKKLRDLK